MEKLPPPGGRPAERLPFELGLDGVPIRFGRLASGMIYALAIAPQGMRLALAGASLHRALRAGGSAVVLTPQEPAQFLRKLALAGIDLQPYVLSGFLRIEALWTGQCGLVASVGGSRRRLSQTLQSLNLPVGSLVVLDSADAGFCLNDSAAALLVGGALQTWVDQHHHTLLTTFAGPIDDLPSLQQLAERFGGLAIMREVCGQAVLEVMHWFGATGAMARSSYLLEIESGGVRARPTFGRESIDPQLELNLATQSAAIDFPRGVNGWTQAESIIDAVDKARAIVGGTVMLHFDQMTLLRELAQAIALLRASPRPQLRIVVRECGARLRVPQVAALMRLGMNMVIPQEVTGQAAVAMAESLRGTLSARHYEIDLDRLLDGADMDLASQVVGVVDFRRQLVEMLARAQALQVPICLVRFSAVTPQAMRSVIGALSRGRNCLLTQHDGGGWMVLYGCLPEQAAGVMARLLGARFEKLLADFQLMGEQGEILRAVRLLEHAAVNVSDAVFENTITRPELARSSESGFAPS